MSGQLVAVSLGWGLTQTQHRGVTLWFWPEWLPCHWPMGGFFCRTPRIRRPNGSGQHAAQIPSLDAKQEQQQLLHETYSRYVATNTDNRANHSHEVIPSCQVLRRLDSASFLPACKRLAEKEIKEAGPMTDGLGALETGRVTKGHWTGPRFVLP